MQGLELFFESNVEILRMRVGEIETLETVISEDAKFLRNERKDWKPRIGLTY